MDEDTELRGEIDDIVDEAVDEIVDEAMDAIEVEELPVGGSQLKKKRAEEKK